MAGGCDGQWEISQFHRLGGTMVQDGIATGIDIPGNRNQSKVRNSVEATTKGS